MAALEAGQKARPIKERFDAAVAVIRSLPAEGTPPGTCYGWHVILMAVQIRSAQIIYIYI